MKRILTWNEMNAMLRAEALEKLRNLALLKVKYDGTLLPYAWAERIAPLLRYSTYAAQRRVWDCQVTRAHHKAGQHSIFKLPILSMDELHALEAGGSR